MRHRDAQRRSLVMLAVLLVTATMLAYTAAIPAGVRAEHSEGVGPIDHFTVEFSESFTTATAGVPIDVTVTAYDHDDVVITDYAGGATFDSTLDPSTTGCSGPCDPSYDTLTFTTGVATAQVTPYLAETDVVLTVTDGTATGSSVEFDVVAGDIATLDVDPDTATIAAGETQAYTATGTDTYGNDLGDVTAGTGFDIDGEACEGASCGSTVADTYTVTGTNDSATDSVSLTVEPGPLDSIELSPTTSTLSADDVPETYSAEGFDEYGNSRGDVTDDTTFGIDGGGSCLTNACGSTTVGEYTVTGDAGGSISDTSTLTVIPGELDRFEIDTDLTGDAVAGTAFGVTVTAYDAHDNVKTDYAGGATLSGLADSPGCAACDPAIDPVGATYGTLIFTDGVATTTITAVAATGSAAVTVTDGEANGTTSAFAVDHSATLGGVTIDAIGTQTAGTSFEVTVRAFDEFGNVKLDQSGGSLSGLADSPGCTGCDPIVAVANADHGTLSWTAGVATADVTAVNAEDGATLTATVGTASNATSVDVVHSATLGGITIDTVGDQVAGTPFDVTVRAFDEFGNVKLDQSGGSLSGLNDSPGCADCQPALPVANPDHGTLAWTDGVVTASVTAVDADAGAVLTATVGTASNTTNGFPVAPGPLGGFVIGAIPTPQTAGTGFIVTATAYDAYGNVKTDYTGGAALTSTLANSPNGTTPTVPASLTWGAGTGVGSTMVTPVKAALTATQTVTLTDGAVSATSNMFAVNPAPVDTLHFSTSSTFYDPSFAGQPLDTKVGAPIYSVCTPPAASATNPCGLAPTTSTGVLVLALDQFGNRVLDGTSVTLGTNPDATGLGTATTVNGVADFTNEPVISTLGNFRLKAASNSKTVVSDQRRIVDELVACTGQTCVNNVGNGSADLQRLYGRVRTDATFFQAGTTNVLLTTQFLPGSETTGQCQGNQTIGQSTDLRVQGLGVGDTAPSTQMVLILPRETMMSLGVTSRGTGNFNVCLGVITVDGSTPAPWKAKDPTSKKFAFKASVARPDGGLTRYWGAPADCGATVVTKGVVEGLSPTDPCIGLRSKLASEVKAYLQMTDEEFAALGVRDADLVIVIEKRAPWDGKGAIY